MATTLKLSPELKRRVGRAARQSGKTPHAFMVEAIAARTTAAEQRQKLVREALKAERETKRTEQAYSMADVHAYVRSVAAGQQARRPRANRWPR